MGFADDHLIPLADEDLGAAATPLRRPSAGQRHGRRRLRHGRPHPVTLVRDGARFERGRLVERPGRTAA
ncbi:hypothetical protein J2S54_000253 [Streptomyces sp. DSM 42143]|uniref:hypothetical protein n=1 Tax=Streptomyces sp. DSM 42143 TaxID=2817711 RepID=UPI0027892EB0|nr:hypothetical protein [Streptomyces sp. DSM 42143]MDQ0383433.1 hypothetical protein [Streptomyces sp. DSM 42143]